MTERALLWLGRSREDVRSFPERVRRTVGYQLRLIQAGQDPTDWRPLPSVGAGVREIRIHDRFEVRVIYVATFAEAVYVLHAFQKQSMRIPRREIALARARLQHLVTWRRRKGPRDG